MKHLHKIMIVMSVCWMLVSGVSAQELSDGDRIRAFGSTVQLKMNEGTELATGFLIDQTGIIITNAHVLDTVDLENPDIVVGVYESTITPPFDTFLARPVMSRGEPMVYDDIDIAVLEVYAYLDGTSTDDREISLTQLTYWNTEAQIADPLYLFGYPNVGENLPVSTAGSITTVLPQQDYASDVVFGEAGSGGPALNDSNQIIGVASANVANRNDDYTLVISLGRICNEEPAVCDLLPEQTDDPQDGPPARRVEVGGYLQCLNARGPSFNLGDRFLVPTGGSGGTYVRSTPSWVINNRTVLIPEGEGGTIVQGPVCGPAAKGELIGWFVQTDDGDTGWVSEGYIFNVRPWIVPEAMVDNWIDYVPEDFVCPDSYGPNFQAGDRFIVPVGDGGTKIWGNPNRAPEAGFIPEGEEGMILEGPECARGSGGLLVSWRVLTDSGLSGWASEGYNDSAAPWISPIVEEQD